MRAAAYIRVSTDEQADKGNSLSEQRERLNAYCISMGWSPPVFFEDDGYSAKNLKRPAIQELIEQVENGKYDIVVTAKLDRLCRNLLELLQLVNLLESHNCGYASVSERFDTSTAAGRMVMQILGAFAEFERERIGERVKDNMLSIAKNSDKAITQACYGYDVIEGKYTINEDEAENVRYMFELAEQGMGHRMIAKMLNDKGTTTKRGKQWDQVNVKRLIKNDTLSGKLIYNKRQTGKGKTVMRDKSEWVIKENNHPAIISPERFHAVQEIMKSRSVAHKHADNETYLLTGLIKCEYCGKNMKGSTSRHKTKHGDYTYYRYICSSYVLGYGCKHHAVHRDDLENKIIEYIKEISSASTLDSKIKITHSRTIEDDINEIKAQQSKINKRMQKQIEAYENDLISADDLRQARERVESEKKKLEEQLTKLESKNGDIEKLKENATNLLGDITGVDRVKAKNSIRMLIDTILIKDAEIKITWKS